LKNTDNSLTIKALWLCSWYPSRQLPFNALFVRRQAEATAAHADITTLLAMPDTEGGKNYRIETHQHLPNMTEVTVYYPKSTSAIVQFIRRFRAYQKGYAWLKKETGKPDLVHLNVIGSAGFYALWLRFFEQLPFIISEHWTGYLKESGAFQRLSSFTKWYYRLTARQSKGIIAMSAAFGDTIRACGLTTQFFYVHNVVDTEVFTPDNRETFTQKHHQPFRLVHASGLADAPKNITGILRGIAELSKRRSDFTLDIMGDANEQAPYKKLAHELGITDKVHFQEDYLSPSEVAEKVKTSDIFVLFSRYESYSVVISEAMSCGIPVVATKTCGIEERVTSDVGILIDSEDEKGLAAAISKIMDNYETYNPLTIRGLVEKKCSPKMVGAAIFEVYQTVLNR
jgi:glycosyltransferase involved in cell wall biosynthesis